MENFSRPPTELAYNDLFFSGYHVLFLRIELPNIENKIAIEFPLVVDDI